MPTWNLPQDPTMMSARDDFLTCPHCGQRTRHSIVRERVVAPVLWCLSCFHARVGDVGGAGLTPPPGAEAGQEYRLAG